MDIYQEYINKYDSLKKYIVFDFKLEYGGIGDCIKTFLMLLNKCIQFNIKLYYMENNILIEKFLLLKHTKMYIHKNKILNSIEIDTETDILNLLEDTYYIYNLNMYYKPLNLTSYKPSPDMKYEESFNISVIKYEEFFNFSEEVILNSSKLLKKCNINDTNYISIHVRLGDKFMEIDPNYNICNQDVRKYEEEKLYNFIESNYNKNIILFSDNKNCKFKIRDKYNKINILDTYICHTGVYNTTAEQVLDTFSEFYILLNSEHIYATSGSGFSHMASLFKKIPYSFI
jgi:hypothetical protein